MKRDEIDEACEQAPEARLRAVLRDAAGSLRWLKWAIEHRNVPGARQARENLTKILEPVRKERKPDAARFLFLADTISAIAERELGWPLAEAEVELAVLRAPRLAAELFAAAAEGDHDEVGLCALKLDEIATTLRARDRLARAAAPTLALIDEALWRARRTRRSVCHMVVAVLNDVIYEEAA